MTRTRIRRAPVSAAAASGMLAATMAFQAAVTAAPASAASCGGPQSCTWPIETGCWERNGRRNLPVAPDGFKSFSLFYSNSCRTVWGQTDGSVGQLVGDTLGMDLKWTDWGQSTMQLNDAGLTGYACGFDWEWRCSATI